jgi:hypothetical protein
MSSANSPILTDRGLSQAESWAVIVCCTALSMAAIVWSWRHDALLNYGDAVAHLHIARRVFDSRTPRFSQLGSVWLPLPHILLIPLVQDYQWWATGLAGVIPSALAYISACAGIYRLARRFVSPAASALSLVFFALNPNLLYLQTTAMTEPLFLCEVIWIVVWLVEAHAALDAESETARRTRPSILQTRPSAQNRLAVSIRNSLRAAMVTVPRRGAWLPSAFQQPVRRPGIFSASSSRFQACVAAALVAAIFTRYDGWIIALLAWSGIALALWARRRLDSVAYWLLTIPVVAAPILWFVYNSVCFGDWLYFARGPYSAKAIELRTATPGPWPLHPGWHNLRESLLFFVKVSELDAVAAPRWTNTWGNLALALAALGFIAFFITRRSSAARSEFCWIFLLWLPVPFYTWSVAYGSVPIFFPAWWPYTLYNTRYGIEMLPALAVGIGLAAQLVVLFFRWICSLRVFARVAQRFFVAQTLAALAFTAFFAAAAINLVQLMRSGPLVYLESTKNLDARLAYDQEIPPVIQDLLSFLPHAPVLMNTSAYPELVAFAGIPLRQTINESDLQIFRDALTAPARRAAVIVAFDGDDIDRAVKAHPLDLAVAARFTANTQPPATIYFSTVWIEESPLLKLPGEENPLLNPPAPPGVPTAPQPSAP